MILINKVVKGIVHSQHYSLHLHFERLHFAGISGIWHIELGPTGLLWKKKSS